MVCIYCSGPTAVSNSRLQHRSNQIWRRRTCLGCRNVVTTLERVDLGSSLTVQVNHSRRQSFNRDRLLLSLYKSLGHRADALEAAQALATTIISKLTPYIEQANLDKKIIIDITLDTLKHFDKAAAIHYRAYHN